jgi:hypothetical protein
MWSELFRFFWDLQEMFEMFHVCFKGVFFLWHYQTQGFALANQALYHSYHTASPKEYIYLSYTACNGLVRSIK